ncbi:MAG: VWA domain-containing protein [Bacillota bacterium]|nr:VWA domain-containing protein [Bacillota bacterium]
MFDGMPVRRLPVYLLLDVSGSMTGEPIEALRQGVKNLIAELNGEPDAIERVWLSIITFGGSEAKVAVPLTPLGQFLEPKFEADGWTPLGGALKLLIQSIDNDLKKSTPTQKGDYKPLVFIMTDGEPNDDWEKCAADLKNKRPANIIAVGCGPDVNTAVLKKITEIVLLMKSYTNKDFSQFFKWVSGSIVQASVAVGAQTAGGADHPVQLQKVPDQIVIVP